MAKYLSVHSFKEQGYEFWFQLSDFQEKNMLSLFSPD